jgi:E3 ubiquitin-protein ligase BRE1
LSNQSANAAINSLDQFFSSLSSSVINKGAQLFSQLKDLKETLTTSGVADQTMVGELEKLIKEREQCLDALEEMKERLDPTHVHKIKGRVEVLESKCERLENDLADARFDLEKTLTKNQRLQNQLAQVLEQKRSIRSPSTQTSTIEGLKDAKESASAPEKSLSPTSNTIEKSPAVSNEELETLKSELEEAQKLSEARLTETHQLTQQIITLKQDIEKLKLSNQQVPDNAIRESSLYKSLQSQYSILMLEHQQVRNCFDEAKRLLNTAKTQHLMQLEEIRQEELSYQSEVRNEMSRLENSLSATQRDYELLKVEYEKTITANEQAAPIAKELREMVESLQKNIQQLKNEINRYKTRAYKAEGRLQELEKDSKADHERKLSTSKPQDSEDQTTSTAETKEPETTPAEQTNDDKIKTLEERIQSLEGDKKELEDKLDTYTLLDKEKIDLITAEKKSRLYIDDLKKKMDDHRKEYEKKKEHMKEDHKQLQREVNNKKQEAQALMGEMESITQAFEEMQEQNIRLLQQLKEKDDANLKLMSERIKAQNIQKLLTEEKQLFQSELSAITAEKDRLNNLVQKLEDREKNSDAAIASSEKEMNLRQQVIELYKKKALESNQQLQEQLLKMNELESLRSSTQQSLLVKTEECENESQNTRRIQEEVANVKRRLEKYRQREWTTSSDEVLLEEIKTYRTKLNCPVCTSRKKDTVLTKCFHVFCSECIKTRYETRQRKCPKCNAAFGANDFHKIYLS